MSDDLNFIEIKKEITCEPSGYSPSYPLDETKKCIEKGPWVWLLKKEFK